jgi:hypothetical protein
MTKKKTKRVDTRRVFEGENAVKKQKFFESGVPASLLMLLLFVFLAGMLLTINRQLISSLSAWNFSVLRDLFIITALMFMISLSLGLYVALYEPRIIKNHLRGAVLLTMLLILIAIVRFGVFQEWSPYLILIPVLIAAIMITIAYNQRFALAVGSYIALVGVLTFRQNPKFIDQGISVLLTTGLAMGIVVLALKEIRNRLTLIRVCSLTGILVFIMTWIVGLWQNDLDPAVIWINSIVAIACVMSVGFLMQGILPVIERLFQTATSLTLLDYSEATKPLLKRLAVEVPGTFNHSFQIGMMAEAAAETIGANGLLCRVGSYYHDIGKLTKPRYFVENQAELFNQHKELSPTMSRMIILGHVKDGLELAHEYKLPKILHQFIATHHGTTLVEFFYHEATKKEAEAGRTVVETEFRYPGPKPASKEAAIVMIADAVEGATRAMQEPTPNRIETVVHTLAMKRLQDGQFDDCDLTMRELHQIEISLIKSLCGMYHSRIAYPKLDKDKTETHGKPDSDNKTSEKTTVPR